MSNSNTEVIVAAVALIVSAVALIATFMQVLQQYYASAQGYSQCTEQVMGDWAKTKSRRFSWEELRFEVQYDAPVIFVSPPTNDRGPIPEAKIYFLDGTQQSLKDTWTTSDLDPRKEYQKKSEKERIHTADNELASWFVLLYAVQRMEAKSWEWQQEQYRAIGPPSSTAAQYGLPSEPPDLKAAHTMTVALQRKRKTWDTMPTNLSKPYATTTVCHLIEMVAALGIYWKEFDRKYDRYRAEGNGFAVRGERVSDLGLMFSIQVYGQCNFGRNRVIPVDEVKEYCFGYVPTIFRETLDRRRLQLKEDEGMDISSLAMANTREISETLTVIGCNNNTTQYFLDERKRTSHLFPISFELLGMLGRTLHIENSSYTFVPNPTPDRWEKSSVSLIKVLESYSYQFEHDLAGATRSPIIVARIKHHIRRILNHQDEHDCTERLLHLKALHAALDDTDEILTAKSKITAPNAAAKSRPSPLTREPTVDVNRQAQRREIVQDVLRSHIQEVLRLLNEREDRSTEAQSLHVPDFAPPSPTGSHHRDQTPRPPPPRFEDMNAASPDDRQRVFMEVYFEVIRRRVVPRAVYSTGRRASMSGASPNSPNVPSGGNVLRRRGTSRTQTGYTDDSMIPDTPLQALRNSIDVSMPLRSQVSVVALDPPVNTLDTAMANGVTDAKKLHEALAKPLAMEEASHDDIWCTLVFRMICWLMLHDFNKADVQVTKSELRGSRMPVYIT